ncbi:MAG: pyrroline-5-carboxylate reductase [Treponema sp.]|nr:pyrroline-5-carboxylate reductase [Treponema sp.]
MIGIIGTGMMGSALICGIAKNVENNEIFVYDIDKEKANELAKKQGFQVADSERELAKKSNQIILAVKPQFIANVIREISDELETKIKDKILISVAAGVKIEEIEKNLNEKTRFNAKIIRLMPNLPALVGQAMIALCANENVTKDEVENVKKLLSGCGLVEQVSENLMDVVTGVSGSGPAYGFMFIEAMADAAVLHGMPRNQAYVYAAQTLKGAAEMVLKTGNHPAALKDAVCSPGGTTIEGVCALEDGNFRYAIISAVEAATKKSEKLGK